MTISAPRYTVAEIEAFPEDGQRYELLDGILLVTPFPSPLHQVLAGRLAIQVYNSVTSPGLASTVLTGVLEIGANTLLMPDILVWPSKYNPGDEWRDIHEWWLAVEVLSPSSRVYDREFKRPAYQAIGVEDVWIVDPDARTVEVWERGAAVARVERERIEWRGMTIELGKAF